MVLGSDLQSFKGWECQEGEKRWSTDASIYFYRVFSLPFLSLRFLFLCSLILTFFFSYSPLHCVFYSWLPPFLLYCLIPWDFSILSLRFHQPFFFFLWAPLQDNPLTRWLPGHYLYSKCVCCTIFIPGQNSLFCSSPFPLSALPEWIRIGGSLSLNLPIWHASSGLSFLLASSGWNVIQVRHFPLKGALARTPI